MDIFRCGARIDGPTVMDGRKRRPISRRYCKRKVAKPGAKCWQHADPTREDRP